MLFHYNQISKKSGKHPSSEGDLGQPGDMMLDKKVCHSQLELLENRTKEKLHASSM
jgi:hypothetical protein